MTEQIREKIVCFLYIRILIFNVFMHVLQFLETLLEGIRTGNKDIV